MNKLFLTLFLTLLLNFNIANAQILTGEEIQAATLNKIGNYLEERGDFRRREVQFFQNIRDIMLPDGLVMIDIDMPGRINYAGMTSVTVRCRIDGKIVKTLNFTVRVRIYDVVLTATHDLINDKNITTSDFRQEEIAIDGRNDYIKDFNVIKDLVPSHMIRAGSPVTLNMFRAAMVIKVNQPVRLLIKYNGVEASAKGIALIRGRVGEIIRVKNESSGKVVTGKVIDENTVEVTF